VAARKVQMVKAKYSVSWCYSNEWNKHWRKDVEEKYCRKEAWNERIMQ
jgi:hypothetical protein